MKRIGVVFLSLFFIVIISSCKSDSKAKTWSKDQETQWKKECVELLESGDNTKADAEDFCDCMFEKTSEKYTPEEAASLTEEQEAAVYQECDYQW